MSEHDQNRDDTQAFVPLVAGAMVAQFRIVDKHGAGGMGEVFLAEDTKLKRRVALKFLPHSITANPETKLRFVREAEAIARLNHPNIVTIHDVGEFAGRPFIVMEYVEGETLHHYAHDKPLPLDMVAEYAIQICQGIAEAHRAGIIHRDIKTSNIKIDGKGRARLLDFGLATVSGEEKLTRTGSTVGTVAYMSPEQVSGREIDHRSDLFSFGVVLYELIAGRTPFRQESEGATLRAIMQDPPEPLSRYKSGVPERMQQIVIKLLEKDREMRYQTAEDVIADLKRLIYDSQQPLSQTTVGKRRSIRTVAGAAALVVILAVAAYFIFRPVVDTGNQAADAVPMIAVLPFENLGNPDDEYFADGMTEEITSRLAGIPGLGVISRTSAMKFKGSGKTIKEIGRELGVDYILEGSVRWAKSGGQAKVRITPQLVRVSDDRHLWADNYERAIMEVFAVQEDIAVQIVRQMGLTLLDSKREQLASRPTENEKAYEFYLKGISASGTSNLFASSHTIAFLDSAVMYDPSFALAHAARSKAYAFAAFFASDKEFNAKALEASQKALELQPGLPQAHLAAGVYYNLVETDYDRALAEFNMARSELHSDAELLSNIALVLLRQGKFDEAHENFRRATELDPLDPALHLSYAMCLRYERNFVEAEAAVRRALALDSKSFWAYLFLAGIRVSRSGDWSHVKPVFAEALAHTRDTLSLAGSIYAMNALWWGNPFDSLFGGTGLTRDSLQRWSIRTNLEIRDTSDADFDRQMCDYYFIQASFYREADLKQQAATYYDSTRASLDKLLADSPDDHAALSQQGMVMAELGRCDEAVDFGTRGKEALSIDECHW